MEFTQNVSDEQQKKNDETTSAIENGNNKITEVNPEENTDIWNSFSEEEKAKILKDLKQNKEE